VSRQTSPEIASEYHFADEKADAIVRTTAYHRNDYDFSVTWFSTREHVDIRLSIQTSFRRTSGVGLGSLDRLPIELLHDTLFSLDMLTSKNYSIYQMPPQVKVNCITIRIL
jgi:hypothetical protein